MYRLLFASDFVAERIETALRSFLKEPKIPRNADPLVYWKENGSRYPDLLPYALQYLCAPMSTACSERQFSLAGRVQAGMITGMVFSLMLYFLIYEILILFLEGQVI